MKLALQRLIGGCHGPTRALLRERGGAFTEDLVELDVEIDRLCEQNFEATTARQRVVLADKPRPKRSFLAHKLMQLERPKVDQMEQWAEPYGAPVCGLLGDANINRPSSLEEVRRAQRGPCRTRCYHLLEADRWRQSRGPRETPARQGY